MPGGGAYADSDVGACGSTGDGDVHLRFLPCYQVLTPLDRMTQAAAVQVMRCAVLHVMAVTAAVASINRIRKSK